jgi:hypothetical protein
MMVAIGIMLLVYPRLIDLWRTCFGGCVAEPPNADHGPAVQAPSPSAPDQDRLRSQLERLLKRAPSRKTDAAQREWASEVKPLLDAYLGPGPTSIHSVAYYDFAQAVTHTERTAVLKGTLAIRSASGSRNQLPRS